MKQLIGKGIFLMLILTTLCMTAAQADRFADTYTDEPPVEVLLHILENYPEHLMEDYIAITGTSRGDYGFALMSQGRSRILLGYRDDGRGMAYWMRNADAVPQGEGYAFFRRHSADAYVSRAIPARPTPMSWAST